MYLVYLNEVSGSGSYLTGAYFPYYIEQPEYHDQQTAHIVAPGRYDCATVRCGKNGNLHGPDDLDASVTGVTGCKDDTFHRQLSLFLFDLGLCIALHTPRREGIVHFRVNHRVDRTGTFEFIHCGRSTVTVKVRLPRLGRTVVDPSCGVKRESG